MGGLTVLAELRRTLPDEDFIYLGDTARVPYGSRSARTVERYSLEVADYLMQQGVKMLVIACNTATAHAYKSLRQKLPVPVVGVIEPGVAALLRATKNRRVGIIGTRSTIRSGSYEQALKAHDPELSVFSKACPLFVPLIEEGWMDKKITALVIEEYLSEMVREEIDSIVLGCTHYPLLRPAIQKIYPDLQLIDSSVEVARSVARELLERKLQHIEKRERGKLRILLTDVTDQLRQLEQLFLGMTVEHLEEVQIDPHA
ncbi:MAG: glutamate racemase [Spirochaetales bacterium]|nr:glutamate racemase [Spirochaetales bacterium]